MSTVFYQLNSMRPDSIRPLVATIPCSPGWSGASLVARWPYNARWPSSRNNALNNFALLGRCSVVLAGQFAKRGCCFGITTSHYFSEEDKSPESPLKINEICALPIRQEKRFNQRKKDENFSDACNHYMKLPKLPHSLLFASTLTASVNGL